MLIPIISQLDPSDRPLDWESRQREFLPFLNLAVNLLYRATGYRWRITSHWRDSESHRNGFALDVAPDIDDRSLKYYAVTNNSDPVLYKRMKLIRQLQAAAYLYNRLLKTRDSNRKSQPPPFLRKWVSELTRRGFITTSDVTLAYNNPYDIAYFIEPDHIHIALANPEVASAPSMSVIKWGIVKSVYPDSRRRSAMPLITSGCDSD